MRKILLILALALGVKVNAQIVGGYLPRNSSTSTATIGTIRTNSLVVTASTISVGAKTLTAGNTGTVAVLSDVETPYYFICNNQLDPSDADVRFTGIQMPQFTALYTATSAIGFYVNQNIEVVRCDIQAWNNGVIGTAENTTVCLVSGTTNTLGVLNGSITSNSQAQFTNTVSINVSAGTRILLKWIFPTFATNPTSVWYSGVLYCRRKT